LELIHALRALHIVGATVLLGTGAGIAFFMVMAHRTANPVLVAHTAATVVVADFLFTATAVIVQPLSGALLAWKLGWSLTEPWIVASLCLYLGIGVLWLSVLWLQLRMRNLATSAVRDAQPLPPQYFTLYRAWFACGVPAFLLVLVILWMMVTKPALW
jgi:uncharacterized membrane protein